MVKKRIYFTPQFVLSELETGNIICDSYNSGIDDFDYEQIDFLNP